MDGCLQPFCAPRTLPSPQTRRARPGTHAHRQQMDGEDGVGHRRATLPQTPAASASLGTSADRPDGVCQRQETGGGAGRGGGRTRAGSGGLERARGCPALAPLGTGGHRYLGTPGRVLRRLRLGSAPLWTSAEGHHLSMQLVPSPTPAREARQPRPPPPHTGSISTLRAEAGSWGPAPRPPEAGGAGSKCLTLRPPADPSSIRDAAAGAPTLALRTPAPHRRAPSTLERWDPRGGAGCPQAQAGAMRCPLHFCQCLTSWRPTLGCPTAGGCPLCTLTPWRRGARHRDQEGWWKCTRPPGGKALREAGWRGPHRLRGLH